MEISEYITLFSWGLAISLQATFMLMAGLIFIKSKEKLFGWYALYCFLMFLYCTTKIPDFIYPAQQVSVWKSHYLYRSFYWYIQILYHLTYLSFGIRFVNLAGFSPKLYHYVLQYQRALLGFSTLVFLATVLKLIKASLMLDFFLLIFMPLHITLSIALLIKIIRLPKKSYTYITGALCYMILILLAFTLSYYQTSIGPLKGPAVFYTGVAFESSIFSLGLGLRIRDIYREKLFFQYNLNEANLQLQQELTRQIAAQQREKKLLTELRDKQQLDIEVEKLHNRVLRSQLNSHFIFNVLNSIKLFILENNPKQASDYLSRFSRFIRKVLDSSMHEYHSLKEELDIIKLYIGIEKTRLGSDFDFAIQTDSGIALNDVKIPTLLLQPIVENAVWHGIMQSNGEKSIFIRAVKIPGNVVISIEDSGPGIECSRQPIRHHSHKSYGLKILENRIQHHNNQNSTTIRYSIANRSLSGKTGTRVEVSFALV